MGIIAIGAIILFFLAYLLYRKVNKRSYVRMGLEYPKILNMAAEGLAKTDENGAVMTSRLAAIYSLAHIAEVHLSYHNVIMIILCAYVRQNSPNTNKADKKDKQDEPEPLRYDIFLTLDIIKNRSRHWFSRWIENRKKSCGIDLRNCDLHGTSFGKGRFPIDKGAHFNGVILVETNLTDAEFNGIDMTDARLDNANMTKAQLWETNLTGAIFRNTNLTSAYIRDTNLTGAWFSNTNMMNANTSGAYTSNSDLSGCKNLTQEQIDKMFCGAGVEIPEGLTRPEHWPTKHLSYKEFAKAYSKWKKGRYKK